jgi:hypothetical protein
MSLWSDFSLFSMNKFLNSASKDTRSSCQILISSVCGSGYAWIRINLGLSDPDPHWECEAGSRRAKSDPQKRIKVKNCIVISAGAFSCSLAEK